MAIVWQFQNWQPPTHNSFLRALSLAERERGLWEISSEVGNRGFFVSRVTAPDRSNIPKARLTARSSVDWKLMTAIRPAGANIAGPCASSAERLAISPFTAIRNARNVRVAGA